MPFFRNKFTLNDYLALDDGTLTTYFTQWKHCRDKILADLAHRFLDRRPLKSAEYDDHTVKLLPKLRKLIQASGFNSAYYTATNASYKLPYDTYHPRTTQPQTQIELIQPDGELVELSDGLHLGEERFWQGSRGPAFLLPEGNALDFLMTWNSLPPTTRNSKATSKITTSAKCTDK